MSQAKLNDSEQLYVIGDTCQVNLGHLQDIIIDKSDLGVLNDDHTLGYHLHGSIVLGSNYESKGISNVITYRRPFPDSDEGQKLKATKK